MAGQNGTYREPLPKKEQKGELVARPLGGAEVADPIAHHLGDTVNRLQRACFLQHLCPTHTHTHVSHAHPIATVMVMVHGGRAYFEPRPRTHRL